MVNKEEIAQILDRDFTIAGTYTIDDQGVVNVDGDVIHTARQSRIYVTFGEVTGRFVSRWRGLKNLKGIPTRMGNGITITYYDGMPVLRCLAADKRINLQATVSHDPNYWTDRTRINSILEKYLGKGKAGAILAAAELIKSGYKESARW
jgi:hypothetical protein